MVGIYPRPLCYVASFDINVTTGTNTLTSERISTSPVNIWSELSFTPIPHYDDTMLVRTRPRAAMVTSDCN